MSIHHRHEPDFSLSAFKLDGESISVKQLAAVGENQGTVRRPDSCAFLIHGASAEGKTRLYDVTTGDDLEYVPAEGQVYWAEYPPRQAYTE